MERRMLQKQEGPASTFAEHLARCGTTLYADRDLVLDLK
jgi:hypothetical protein